MTDMVRRLKNEVAIRQLACFSLGWLTGLVAMLYVYRCYTVYIGIPVLAYFICAPFVGWGPLTRPITKVDSE